MSDRISRTSFYTIAAENAAGVVDVVDGGVAFSGGDTIRMSIFRSFNVNTVCGTGCRAKETTDTFLQPILIALQDVNAAIARLDARRDDGEILRGRLLKHGPQGDAEAFYERDERLTDFSNDRGHRITLANLATSFLSF